MEEFKITRSRGWKFWLLAVIVAVGVVLTIVGVIANFVEMGVIFGYISLFSFVTYHWSFWVAFCGIVILVGVLIFLKISKKMAKNS